MFIIILTQPPSLPQNPMGPRGSGAVATLPQPIQQTCPLGGRTESADSGSKVVVTPTAQENKLCTEMAGESKSVLSLHIHVMCV